MTQPSEKDVQPPSQIVQDSWREKIITLLEDKRQASLYRQRRLVSSPQQPRMVVDGEPLLSFCSNDYLGFANNPEIKAAFIEGVERYGCGSGASHLVNGHSEAHHQLEEQLAEFVGFPRALLFSSGYAANLAVLSALVGRHDHLLQDRLNHASLIDGGVLSRARVRRFAHADVTTLAHHLTELRDHRVLVATDAVFSMDGDIAPLSEYVSLLQPDLHWLMVDDAHGFGVLGEQGRGTLHHCALTVKEVPLYMGTLGKAAGVSGAFVAGSEETIEYLIQQARSYIYTTALPPAQAFALQTVLRLIATGDRERQHLQYLIDHFKAGIQQLGLYVLPSSTAIQPIIVGSADRAMQASQQLLEAGILVSAIRPPTVPQGGARLRVTLSAAHQLEDVNRLLVALSQLDLANGE